MVGQLKPKVTIGVCARNSEDSIGLAIESIVRQDFPHDLMEVIFVDDGSQDNTLAVIKDYASRMDITSNIFSGDWRGLGKARNTVIYEAEGEYIIWVDADEILLQDFVRKQIDLIEQNPKAGIVTGKLGILQGENLILTLELIPSVVEYSTQDWKDFAKLPGTGGATFRVTSAKEVGGFDENIKSVGEDIDIAARIKRAGWSVLRGEAVFYERHGQLSTWTALLKRKVSHGIQSRRLSAKSGTFFSLYRMNPAASFLAGIRYTFLGYKITKKKVAFLLPFEFALTMTAWFYGFSKHNRKSVV